VSASPLSLSTDLRCKRLSVGTVPVAAHLLHVYLGARLAVRSI
jgi:hypothetical protein